METSKTSTGETLNDLTLFAVDTPANHLAPQENAEAQTIHDTSGLGLEMPLALYDRPTQSWRMSEDISLWGDYKSLENLPKSGMTRNGELYQQPVWVRLIDETASSSWPTPRNCSAMAATITPESAWNPKRFPNLETVVGRREWPTPTTQETEHPNAELTATGRRKSKDGSTSHSLGLADAVQMWPTPTVDDSKNVTRTSGAFQSLTRKVMENPWPTPTASSWGNTGSRKMLDRQIESGNITEDDKRRMTAGNGGKLNPMWVEWLMGFPLGWTDLED
jgi:DNA (cytosine-5)-methyltransferase 1